MDVSRRAFVGGSALAAGAAQAANFNPVSELNKTVPINEFGFGIERYLGLEEQLAGQSLIELPAADPLVHLLNRCSFGLRREDLEQARLLGADHYLEQQLHPELHPDALIEAEIAYAFPNTLLPRKALAYHYSGKPLKPGGVNLGRVAVSNPLVAQADLRGLTIYRAAWSQQQLYEVMVEFWSNHFNIWTAHSGNVAIHKLLDDREVIRPHALGNFRDLLIASAKSTAMLIYLDGYVNTLKRPNENYARELMELHTLGASAMGQADGYSEQDIREVARCFTGWTVNFTTAEFMFDPLTHDFGPKTVFGETIEGTDPVMLGNGPRAIGSAAGGGISDGLRVIEMLVRNPRTARFLATKLVRRFVADEPPAELVDEVAAAYGPGELGGDIRAMLRTLLGSRWMRDPAYYQKTIKLKRPFELYISALRATDAHIARDKTPTLSLRLEAQQHVPHNWEPPTGYPDYASYWLSSEGMLQRWLACSYIGHGGDGFTRVNLTELRNGAESPEALVDQLIDRVLHRPLSAPDRQRLVDHASTHVTAHPGARRWDLAAGSVLALLLCSPYFQVR